MGKGQKKGRSKNFKPLDQAQLVQSTSQPQPGGSGASARTDQRQAASVRVDNIPQSSSGKGPSVDVKTQDPTISQKNKSVDQRNVWANQSQQSNKPGPSSEQTIRKTAETPISGNPKGRNQSDSFANLSKKSAWSRNANWKTDERHTSGNTRDKTEVEQRQSYDTRTEKGSGYQEHKKSYVDKQITSVANKLADTNISGSSSKPHYDQKNSSASKSSGSTNQRVSLGEKTERSPEKHIDMRIVPSKPGTKGRAIRVETNYVSINLGKHKSIIHYDVKITPEVRIKRMIREIMSIFRENYYNDRYPAFDNMSNLYSVTLLGGQENLSGEVEFEGKTYKIDLQFAKTVDLTPLQNIFSAEMTPQDALQVVNIVLRSGPSSRLLSAGRSFFFKNQPCVDLKDGMQLYSGFYQSAVRGSKLLLNIDVSHKAVPKDKTLLEIVDEFFRNKDTLQHWQIQKLGDFLKGLKVTYQIPGNSSSKRSYKVNGVRESAASRETFSLEGGKQITVQQYYATEKNYRLKYPDLPAIHVGDPKRSIFVPLELCKIEKEQMVRKNLTDNNKREMIANTATSTYDRKQKIQGCISKVNYNNDPTVNEFGITVGDQFLQLTARVLDPPNVFYSDRKVVTPNKGQWNRLGDFKKADVKSWIVVSCVEERYFHQNDLQKLADQIKYYSQLPRSQFVNIIGNRERNIMSFFENKKNQQFDVVFVVVSDRAEDRSYSYVKQAAELHTNCITQCLKQKTAKNIISDDRRGSQTIANIMLKVNAKLNGINHVLKDLPDILKNCMVMGADVTHPGPHSNIPSVAAVTASHDDRASQYNICWRLQKGEGRQELIQDMRTIVREHLTFYKTERGCLPMKIVFYRDGVSEGEFQQVLNSEVRDIRAACHDLDAKYKPLLTFLVVLKRHHTRLFPTNKEDIYDTRYFNVPAGTCVDTEITNPSMQDFYLVSHTSIKGVAKPTRYCTLLDENNLSNDDIEQLSYYLCHLYSRCTRSVSYPAPTYYAHLVAARGKVYISTIKNLDMENLEVVCKRMIIANKIRHTHPMFFV